MTQKGVTEGVGASLHPLPPGESEMGLEGTCGSWQQDPQSRSSSCCAHSPLGNHLGARHRVRPCTRDSPKCHLNNTPKCPRLPGLAPSPYLPKGNWFFWETPSHKCWMRVSPRFIETGCFNLVYVHLQKQLTNPGVKGTAAPGQTGPGGTWVLGLIPAKSRCTRDVCCGQEGP